MSRRSLTFGFGAGLGLGASAGSLLGGAPASAAAGGASIAQRAGARTGRRTYAGKVLYLTDGTGEMGREWFRVTVEPDGTRTLRATCELDDDRILRDVVLTVGADWRPVDAFVRITTAGRLVGSSWFRFSDRLAECEGFTATEGRFRQALPTEGPTDELGTHPVHADAWGFAHFPSERKPGRLAPALATRFSTSNSANGGTGPKLVPSPSAKRRRYIGRERIDVAAGRFDVEHFQDVFPNLPAADLWVTPGDFVPVRLRWDYRNQTYDLVQLEGEAL